METEIQTETLPTVKWHELKTFGWRYEAVARGTHSHSAVAWISLKKEGDLYLARYSDGRHRTADGKPMFEAKTHTLINARHYIAGLFAKYRP